MEITAILGDITQDNSEAIVNAANETLLGGGGVDGAIHRRAGHQLREECRSLGGCEQGEAKATHGYDLSSKYVIHTVGPRWHDISQTKEKKDELLRSCYLNSLRVANNLGVKSIAFPSISTGGFVFPIHRAAKIAVNTVKHFVESENKTLESIKFICFDNDTHKYYDGELSGNPLKVEEIKDLQQELKMAFDPYSLFKK